MTTTNTLPAIPTLRRTTIVIAGALVAAAIALALLVTGAGSTDAPAVDRTSVAETSDRIGTADAAARRASLADAYRGDSRRVGSADAGERWGGR